MDHLPSVRCPPRGEATQATQGGQRSMLTHDGSRGGQGASVLSAHICLAFDLRLQAELSTLVTQGQSHNGAGT